MFHAEVSFFLNHMNYLPHSVSLHFHDCYEIVYYLTGTGVSTIDGVDYHYSNNTFCIIPPNTYHSEVATTETEILYAGFNYDNSLGSIPPCLLKDKDNFPVLVYMQNIKNEMSQQANNFNTAISLSLRLIIIEIFRLYLPYNNVKSKSISPFEYIVNFINANYATDINIKTLATSINYSYDRFRHIFKEVYGISPLQYIINARINQAKLLLKNGSKSITEIAKLCGFNGQAQFITTFKKETGIPPSKYRHNLKHNKEVATFLKK